MLFSTAVKATRLGHGCDHTVPYAPVRKLLLLDSTYHAIQYSLSAHVNGNYIAENCTATNVVILSEDV